jgi:hypothetical protein
MIRDADALVYLGGRVGTLLEYCAAFDGCDKPMYVLYGSGGAVDRLISYLTRKQRKSGPLYVTDHAFDLVSRLDDDLKISNFKNDPRIQIIDDRNSHIHGCWAQWTGYNPDKRTIVIAR